MNRAEFKEEFKKTLDTMFSIMEKKNADYAKTDPFGNFKLVETLGITTVEKSILVRMADKMSRISNLTDQEAMVKDEAIEDTLQDLANYSIILKLYLSTLKTCKKHDDNYVVGMDLGSPEGDSSIITTKIDGKREFIDITYMPAEIQSLIYRAVSYFNFSKDVKKFFEFHGTKFGNVNSLLSYLQTTYKKNDDK